jgi:hypothetical protein
MSGLELLILRKNLQRHASLFVFVSYYCARDIGQSLVLSIAVMYRRGS